MKTSYSIKSTIKYPQTNENGVAFDLREHKDELENAIQKFNEKHDGVKHIELQNVEENAIYIVLDSASKLKEDNMGKELTYLSRVLKSEYNWGEFSKYDTAFLAIEELSIINNKTKGNSNVSNTKEVGSNGNNQLSENLLANIPNSNNTGVSKIIQLGKQMVNETFGMSISELLVMKQETSSIVDMKNIVQNLQSIVDLLENDSIKKESSL